MTEVDSGDVDQTAQAKEALIAQGFTEVTSLEDLRKFAGKVVICADPTDPGLKEICGFFTENTTGKLHTSPEQPWDGMTFFSLGSNYGPIFVRELSAEEAAAKGWTLEQVAIAFEKKHLGNQLRRLFQRFFKT